MTKEDFERDFMPPDLVLKLIRDIGPKEYQQKVALIHEHFEALKTSGDHNPLVLELKKNEQLAFIYWDADLFDQSAVYYEKILDTIIPEVAPNSYSMAAFMIIRAHRLAKNYAASAMWVEKILDKPELLSSFSKLDVLSEYVDLLHETGTEFDKKYEALILEIITDLGFPVVLDNNPLETISNIKELNTKWNRKLPRRRLPDAERKQLLEEYIHECEVEWYKHYAQERLAEMVKEAE